MGARLARLGLCLALVVLVAPRRGQADTDTVEVRSPAEVRGLRLADADGDGIVDLLLIDGRTVQVYRGRPKALPQPAPTWIVRTPDDASFVDVAPPGGGEVPALLTLGRSGAARVPLVAGVEAKAPPTVSGSTPLTWRDSSKVTFSDMTHPGGALLLPGRDGWSYRPRRGGKAIELKVTPHRTVAAPGPFLEDTSEAVWGLPDVYVGRAPWSDAPAESFSLWSIDGASLVAQGAEGHVRYDLAFLENGAAAGRVDRQLVDLDGDKRPELIHQVHENRETRYGFFRTSPAEPGSSIGPTHKPATSALYLPGYQFPPDLVDIDGDGLLDLVVTGIAINPANTLLAMTTGKVTAETLAFRNQGPQGKGFFGSKPDAVVTSKIGVNVRFSYRGTIDVQRFFTILADADVDGDGRKDLVIRTSDHELTVRRGTAGGVWEKEGRKVPIPPRGAHPDIEGYAGDLDGDGRDEIVLLYRAPPGGKDRVFVIDA